MSEPKKPESKVVEETNHRVVEMVKTLSNADFVTLIRQTGGNSLIRLSDADQQQQQQQQGSRRSLPE